MLLFGILYFVYEVSTKYGTILQELGNVTQLKQFNYLII